MTAPAFPFSCRVGASTSVVLSRVGFRAVIGQLSRWKQEMKTLVSVFFLIGTMTTFGIRAIAEETNTETIAFQITGARIDWDTHFLIAGLCSEKHRVCGETHSCRRDRRD